ncbi:MAG: hypothetical protein IIX62_02725, partial [Peptococcaceae bacterium]|nr:hypothetical protein [Peptococcaceae bacterium]
ERYQSYQRPGVFDEFYRNGIWMQVNASYFADRATRRKALRQLRTGQIRLIGSDCHGLQKIFM